MAPLTAPSLTVAKVLLSASSAADIIFRQPLSQSGWNLVDAFKQCAVEGVEHRPAANAVGNVGADPLVLALSCYTTTVAV